MMRFLLCAAAALSLSAMPALTLTLRPVGAAAEARHHWKRGDVLPPAVLGGGPNVNYAAQRLRRPPEGYGWFSVDGAFVLASLANGLILEVVEG